MLIRVNLSDLLPLNRRTLVLQLRFCFVSIFLVVDSTAQKELKFLSKCKLYNSYVVEGNKLIVLGSLFLH